MEQIYIYDLNTNERVRCIDVTGLFDDSFQQAIDWVVEEYHKPLSPDYKIISKYGELIL